jgi:hypothetical protein
MKALPPKKISGQMEIFLTEGKVKGKGEINTKKFFRC